MPKITANKVSFKHPKFAPLTLDFTFKKAFANEQSTELLLFLLNTFLAEKLKSPIKKVSIINSEQLGKTRLNRNAVFDVYCEDASGARFIVEVQVDKQEHFIRRTFYYLCMIISNLAKKGKKYDFNIPKLYSISFLDFDLDFGKNCTEVVQHLSIRNDKHPEVSYDMLQMTFVILPRFNKTESECKTVMDKILFAFKNGHKLKKAPKSFREKELRDIFSIAEISNFTESELYKYEAIMRNEYDQRAILAYAKKEGEVIGETRGLKKGILQTAKNMLAKGFSVADVLKATNLPREQVRALKRA
ncbi:MAG: Rpn family recombination-promoting nuclease/putative transposase [Fibromonadaceae bacterium]|jgi:predicted transposase/invertase (TIGR01784 family)|nr:Rpn family recombination-promoting nuclease/putative transposase [Fibromonadaceae bacterium]